MKISDIKRDSVTVNGGAWVTNIPGLLDVRLRVRGQGSDAYAEAYGRKLRALVPADYEQGEDGKPTEKASAEALARCGNEALAEAVLIDWDHIEDDNGAPLPFDIALAVMWLTDPDFKHFRDGVLWASHQVDMGRAKLADDVTKNSSAPSSGKSRGRGTPKA